MMRINTDGGSSTNGELQMRVNVRVRADADERIKRNEMRLAKSRFGNARQLDKNRVVALP
jgi:hypothetical protein